MPYPISPKSGWPKSRTREPTCPPGLRWPGYSRPRSTFGAATPRMNRRYRACRSRNIRPPGCALLTEAHAQGGMRGRISSRDPPQLWSSAVQRARHARYVGERHLAGPAMETALRCSVERGDLVSPRRRAGSGGFALVGLPGNGLPGGDDAESVWARVHLDVAD
jgi:hypothetical protein